MSCNKRVRQTRASRGDLDNDAQAGARRLNARPLAVWVELVLTEGNL